MPHIEIVRRHQMPPVQEARFFIVEDLGTEVPSKSVIDGITQDRGNYQQHHQQVHVHAARRGQRAGHEQQRVARQKRRDHQAGLAKYNQEQNRVDPGAVVLDQRLQMLVEVQYKINECRKEFHDAAARNLDDFFGGFFLGAREIFAAQAQPHQQRAADQHRGIDAKADADGQRQRKIMQRLTAEDQH